MAGILFPVSAFAQDWRTVTSTRQMRGEDELRVDMEYGAGRLMIAPSQTNALYKATLRYDANVFEPILVYDDGTLQLGVDGRSHNRHHDLKSGRLDLTLNRNVPLDLELKFGAVQADIELGGLMVRNASIQTGASETVLRVSNANPVECSELKIQVGAASFKANGLGNLNCERVDVDGGVGDVTLDFNGSWRTNATVDIDMGLGSLTLQVPRGLGVQVRKGGLLASFESHGLVKRDDVYYSQNWEQAGERVSFNIDAAFGSVRMVWVDAAKGSVHK